jgi:hypothetical protein
MLKPFIGLSLLTSALALAVAEPAAAQFGGQMGMGQNYGTNGANGQTYSGMGQTNTGTGTFGGRTLGGGSMGGPQRTAMGSGAGSSAFGGMSQGNGMGQGFGINNQLNVGQGPTGNEWYVPGNRRAGQFVGSDSGDARNFIGAFSQLTGMANQGRNQFGANNQFGNRQNGNRNQQGQNQGRNGRNREERSPMLRSYAAGFSFNPDANPSRGVGQRLATQLSQSRSVGAIGPVQVQMQGKTAVLRGVVASEQERSLAAQMAMLEPGVSAVQNELQISPELPDPTTSPATGSAPAAVRTPAARPSR